MDGWPFPRRTLSPSSMNKFQRCPEQWRRQYLLDEWERTSVSAVLGTAVHESAETNYRQKATSLVDLSVEEIELAYVEAFDKEVEEHGGTSEILWEMKQGQTVKTMTPGKAKDSGVPLTRKYHETVANRIIPVAAEEWFYFNVPGVPVPIRGKIDLIVADRETGVPVGKRDLKFGRVADENAKSSWLLQGLTYMLVGETTDRDGAVRFDGLHGLPFGWHVGSWGGPRSDPKIYVPETSPGLGLPFDSTTTELAQAHIRATVFNMLSLYEEYGPDEPWPTPALQHTWACSYCPFHPSNSGNCYWWVGRKQEVLTLL